ncbi:peptidoglycan-binding protein [Loktanella sp. 3ANDIMAR09]|uniref:peptidoglycan-binding domain-containing protein n=1 Tax=Loktanella sp. 3ANDIMAR09 TaxID=1225657 RepID=UPI000B3208A4|nr:hypothetical protein [Loktanella sp. 3ANDIMAR09]
MIAKAIIAILPLSFASVVSSQTNEFTNIRNAGAFPCEDVVNSLQSPGNETEKTAFLQWTAGFSTAASRANSLTDVFPITDTWTMLEMVALVCNEDSSSTFEAAVRLTIARLRPYWVRDETAIFRLSDPSGKTVQIYGAVIPRIQQKLRDIGFQLEADGIFGNQTGNALRLLGEKSGIEPLMVPTGKYWYILTRP